MINFSNTYQLYKTHITDVAQWLTRVSSDSVDTPPSLPRAEADRSKGNARQSRKGNNHSQTKRITIPSYKLVTMAQQISDGPLKMSTLPPSIVVKLENCILFQESFLAIYKTKSHDGKQEIKNPNLKNRQQAYFIRILKEVLSILKPEPSKNEDAKPVPKAESKASKPSSAVHDLNNFSSLNIGEQESNDDVPIHTTFTVPIDPPDEDSGDLADCAEQDQAILGELFFATFCLFTDMDRFKSMVRQHWELYKTRQISLELVTLISNTAIAAMRKAEKQFIEDFERILPKSPGYWTISSDLYKDIARQRGLDTEGTDYRSSAEMLDVSNLMCLSAAEAFYIIQPLLRTTQCPVVTLLAEKYDPTLDRSTLSIQKARNQERSFLVSLMTPLAILNTRKTIMTPRDEFTIGIQNLHCVKQGPLTVWLNFAATIVIEANAILGVEASRAFDELQSTAREVHSSLTLLNTASLKELTSSAKKDSIQEAQGLMMFIKLAYLNDFLGGQSGLDAELNQPFFLYKHHPLLCGTTALWLRLKAYDLGSFLGVTNNCFLQAAHAYNAFRQLGRLTVTWPEMEKFISYHTPQKIFGGRKPTDFEQCLQSLHLVNGMSIRIDPGPTPHMDHLHWESLPGPKKEILERSSVIKHLIEWATSNQETGHKVMDKLLGRFMVSENNVATSKRHQKDDLVTQVLAMKNLLEKEISYVRSDLCRLYCSCMEVFRKIHSGLDSYFSKECDWIIIYNGADHDPQEIITQILRYRALEHHMDKVIFGRERPTFSSHCIVVGSKLMKEHLKR